MKLELTSISIDTIIQAVSIIAAAVTFVVAQSREKRKDRRVAVREAYQQIELAAIEIFRFEAENLNTIRPIWEQDAEMPKDSSAEYTATMNYVCQMLNLFEIALRFRKQKIILPDVFSSWVAWFYTLLTAPGFKKFWEDTKWDYLPELRNIMDGGLQILDEEVDDDLKEKKFYAFVAYAINCKTIGQWKEDKDSKNYTSFLEKRKSIINRKKTELDTANLKIDWITDNKLASILARFFVDYSGKQYISHSEIQEGRAKDETHWSENLEKHMLDEFKGILKNKPYDDANLVGAWYNDKLAGYLLLEFYSSHSGTYVTLSDIIVDKKYRDREIGKSMVDWVLPKIEQHGITQIFAESNILNHPAHKFLEKMGFKTISKVFMKEL